MDAKIYNEKFHENRKDITEQAAEKVLQYINQFFKISSCVDVGGGIGVWALAQQKINNSKILVLDGEYVNKRDILVKENEFKTIDLNDEKMSCLVNQKFDLVISLEVAEHLLPERASSFVKDLCNLGDVVLFSAAVPGQGGQGHINEKYLSYWRGEFEKENYCIYDVIRPYIAGDISIPFWFRQNMVIFAKENMFNVPRLREIVK